jgi:hypothetical protein
MPAVGHVDFVGEVADDDGAGGDSDMYLER